MPIHSRKGERSGREERPESHCLRFGCSWTLAQKKDGAELALQEPIPAAVCGKIIRILPRVAAVPVFFLCQSLRTAHRIQKTFRAFLSAGPLPFFASVSRQIKAAISSVLLKDIATPPRRALAAATPTTPQCPSSIPLRFISLADIRPMNALSQNSAYMQA